jgi:hypothetical protein
MKWAQGGWVILNDLRWTKQEMRQYENHWWLGRDEEGEEGVDKVRWSLAASPKVSVDGEKGMKEMGGCAVLVWGDMARLATPLKEGQDEYGRWAPMEIKGRSRRVVVTSLYKFPPGVSLLGWHNCADGQRREELRRRRRHSLTSSENGWRSGSGRERGLFWEETGTWR